MVVWGGWGEVEFNTGGRYDPSTDSWTATSTISAPAARLDHSAVWTGNEMIVWGGWNGVSYFNSGGKYNPSMDSWAGTTTSNAPSGRKFHTAKWSGNEMIVWGGDDGPNSGLNSGGRYNPATNSWVATSTTNAPRARFSHTAVWTGSEIVVWGGTDGLEQFNTGGRYSPGTDNWIATPINAPERRAGHTTIWSGSEMMVWGGFNDFGPFFLNTGGRYCAQTAPTISINPSEDNTLYEYVPADGDRSNGVGDYFFAGKTAIATIRRGVLAFDIAGSIPPGSTITSVSLSMHMSMTRFDDAQNVELHKLLADWGEGTSDATGEEGQGAPATTNDATWRHRFYDTIFWTTQGGDFSNTVSASQSVGAIGDYTWSSAQMVADVQSWLDNPVRQLRLAGIRGRVGNTTAKRFDTRESTARLCSPSNTRHRRPRPRPLLPLQHRHLLRRLPPNTYANPALPPTPTPTPTPTSDTYTNTDSYTHSDPSSCLTL